MASHQHTSRHLNCINGTDFDTVHSYAFFVLVLIAKTANYMFVQQVKVSISCVEPCEEIVCCPGTEVR